jgi:AcrR family transcriptional regulator
MARRTETGGRRTAEQTRGLLLRAGVELLRERAGQDGDHVVAAALSHVRFTEVAERATELVRARAGDADAAKVTTGAIYNLWPHQVDYQVDLLLHVAQLQSVLVPGVDQSLTRFRAARDRGAPVDQVVAELARDVHRHYQQDPLFRVELGFLISAHDQRVQQALAHRRGSFFASADQGWQSLLDTYGLCLRPPHSLRDLTTAVAACLIGSTVLSFADADADAQGQGQGQGQGQKGTPDVAAAAAVAVVRAFTQQTG